MNTQKDIGKNKINLVSISTYIFEEPIYPTVYTTASWIDNP